jgi:hypothetical protein
MGYTWSGASTVYALEEKNDRLLKVDLNDGKLNDA